MDLRKMSEELVAEKYHARDQVETREKQIMARWQVSTGTVPTFRDYTPDGRSVV